MVIVNKTQINLEKTTSSVLAGIKHAYLIHTRSNQPYKGAVVNWALPSFQGAFVSIVLRDWKWVQSRNPEKLKSS